MPAAWHVTLSRRVNGALGYSPREMICSRMWRQHHRLLPWVDALFLIARGEREHCRQVHDYEWSRRDLPAMLRREGW
jgi:hypothetical protein